MPQKITILFISCFIIVLLSCDSVDPFPSIEVTPIEISTSSSGMSRLSVKPNGQAIITWLEFLQDGRFQLQFAQLENESWSSPKTIATGSNWFVNWADFPSLYSFENGQFISHWLAMRGEGTYEYDIKLSIAADEDQWSAPITPHKDSIVAEHGFVSMLPIGTDKMMVSWLDGRNTVLESSNYGDQHHGHHGSMSLRTAIIDTEGSITEELELDDRVCDCCQTDMAMTATGPVIVYRDRSHSEIRDIYIVRITDGVPTPPMPVYDDDWKINACPVNGPAVSARDSTVLVSWYTAAYGQPKVQAAISRDNGKNFDLPFQINQGDPLGRVDCTWISDKLNLVTWMELIGDETWICARIINVDGTSSGLHRLIKTQSSRRSGFPTIVKYKDGALLSWTHLEKDASIIKTARVDIR